MGLIRDFMRHVDFENQIGFMRHLGSSSAKILLEEISCLVRVL